VNAKTKKYGRTFLHYAANMGQKEIAQLLIAKGVDVNAKDNNRGETPLDRTRRHKLPKMSSAQSASRLKEIAKFLRKHGGKTGEYLSIHGAADRGDIEAVKQHLAAGTDVNAKNRSGETPLFFAATKEITELLIAKGADVDAKDDGWTPLHAAVDEGHKEVVELLITKGADVNAKDKRGSTSLFFAATKEITELLIAKGADVNAKNRSGSTPLHSAATRGQTEIAALFIAKGADVHAKDEWRSTPLHRAAIQGHKEIVELLVTKGADVNAKSETYGTPLDVAIKYKRTELADLLRKRGATNSPLEAN
jgi:ankyrin repeat protein